MKTALVIALLALLPLAARAAGEPEAVYAKFHRAAASGNLEEMMRHVPAAERAELAAMSAAQKEAIVKMMAAMLPRAYLLQAKTVSRDGKGALLQVSGQGEALLPGAKPELLYGSIRMVLEGGEWKMHTMDWNNTRPAALGQGKPAAAPKPQAAPAGRSQAAPAGRGSTVVGAPPERTLGTARPPCVYKPVMTAEDIENCR